VAAVPDLVAEEDLPSANSLSSIGIQAGRIGGPVLGAAVIGLGGMAMAFALNGLMFSAAALLLFSLRRLSTTQTADALETGNVAGAVASLREGLRTVIASPWLWMTILIFGLGNVMLAGPYSIALPFLVKDHLGADVGTLGMLYAIFPIGYIVAGVWLGRRRQLRQRGLLIYIGTAVAGLMLLLFGLPVPLLVIAVAAFINGAALETGALAWTNVLQQWVPREKLGRVVSVDALGSFALIPLGYAITGWATDLLGAPLVFVIGGGLTALIALLALCFHPAIRTLD
jgi:predicted MFS family arabinose efflux permease